MHIVSEEVMKGKGSEDRDVCKIRNYDSTRAYMQPLLSLGNSITYGHF